MSAAVYLHVDDSHWKSHTKLQVQRPKKGHFHARERLNDVYAASLQTKPQTPGSTSGCGFLVAAVRFNQRRQEQHRQDRERKQ